MEPLSAESLRFIVNHVIMPPHLPQEAENSIISRQAEQDLLRLVIGRVKAYDSKFFSGFSDRWLTIDKMLAQWIILNSTPTLSSKALAEAFAGMGITGEL